MIHTIQSKLARKAQKPASTTTDTSTRNIIIPAISHQKSPFHPDIIEKKKNLNNSNSKQKLTFLHKRNDSSFNIQIPTRLNFKNNTFLPIGNLAQIIDFPKTRIACQNHQNCTLLNQMACGFFKIWSLSVRDWSKEYTPFAEHRNYTPTNLQTLRDIIDALAAGESQNELMMSDLISAFIMNPRRFLETRKFSDLSMREQVLGLFYLIKRQALLVPPKCFCNELFGAHVKRQSSKRKHEALRFFTKKYMLLIMDEVLPNYYILKPVPERKKKFYEMMGQERCPTGAQDLMKVFFNEIAKEGPKGQRTKNLAQLFAILKENTLTRAYFSQDALKEKYAKMCQRYQQERIVKVEKFLMQFRGQSLGKILERIFMLFRNKRFKLFFTKDDMDVGFWHVRNML